MALEERRQFRGSGSNPQPSQATEVLNDDEADWRQLELNRIVDAVDLTSEDAVKLEKLVETDVGRQIREYMMGGR